MNTEKVKFYSPISEEAGVIMAFTKMHEQLGFPKIVESSARGFDIDDIEYKDDNGTHRVTVEFEYYSSSYIGHGHCDAMKDDRKYIVICWEDDCNLASTIVAKYNKYLYKVIELKNFVEIFPDEKTIESNEQEYFLINYNPEYADYRNFSDWKNSNMYSFNNNNNIKVKNASKALVKQGEYIIGGFDIVRFSNIKLSDNMEVIDLYKKLTDYPVSLFTIPTEEIIEQYVNRYVGHIFYNNFFELNNKEVRKTIKDILPDLNISYGAVQHLTKEQYNRLLGR